MKKKVTPAIKKAAITAKKNAAEVVKRIPTPTPKQPAKEAPKMNKALSVSQLKPSANGIVNMPTPKATKEKRFMSMFEVVALANYVQSEWKQFEGKTDVFFAHTATDKLGFPVSPNHITKTCAEFNITRSRGRMSMQGLIIHDAAPRIDLQTVIEEVLKFANRHNFKSDRLDALLEDYKSRSVESVEADSESV